MGQSVRTPYYQLLTDRLVQTPSNQCQRDPRAQKDQKILSVLKVQTILTDRLVPMVLKGQSVQTLYYQLLTDRLVRTPSNQHPMVPKDRLVQKQYYQLQKVPKVRLVQK
jgi:hypothetical protein